MKIVLIKIITLLAERSVIFSLLFNRMWAVLWVLKIKNAFFGGEEVYDSTKTVPINSKSRRINDERLNYFIRVLMEKTYERVVEIGAYDLNRSIQLKSIFPEKEIIGLDVLAEFNKDLVRSGVRTGFFQKDWFLNNSSIQRTLVVSVGTLACFTPEEALEFLEIIYNTGFDIAIAEPHSFFSRKKSLKRNRGSYYHPYQEWFSQIGFDFVRLPLPNHSFSLSGMEYMLFCWCKNPKNVMKTDKRNTGKL